MAKRKNSEIVLEESKRAKDTQMADLNEEEHIVDLTQEDEQTEVIRGLRDVRPAHYLFKIDNFSSLLSTEIDKYESSDFEVSGYKWKLRLFPKGVNEDNKHISLYLVLSKSKSIPFHKEVNVYFKLFVYNQIHDKYLTVQDAKGRMSRFRGTKTEFGFDQLLALSVFNDASNGYLVDDCCIFGAEIFVVEPISKGELASVVKDLSNNTYTWNVEKVSELKQEIFAEVFVIGGYKWSLFLYPNGHLEEKDKSLSLFLSLEEDLNPGHTLFVQFVLRVKDQLHGEHHEKTAINYFSAPNDYYSCGFFNLISLNKLNDVTKGYLINGAIILELKISLITKVVDFS
ncbi:MATH domain and coiled-coil domain-containing protein At2g05410-like isoform X1 [Euphorbia lathyris]|uniref:MATH domain and coiled-coil domain-containing protein At2g05410-like isoform X1 n=1 Tax=Euphorbia lathyris TaxID=212925 RepID=UPI003313A5E5